MKKAFLFPAVLALTAALALPVLAEAPAPLGQGLIAPVSAEETAHAGVQITVDGKALEDDGCVLVPVRSVGEALGFTVTWNPDRTVTLDNGGLHTTITPGLNQYLLVTSNPELIGMSAPISLDAPPILMQGVTYVPAFLFQKLLGGDTLSIADGVIAFRTTERGTELANPIHSHDSLQALSGVLGFDVAAPEAPAGYRLSRMEDISGRLAQLTYTDGTHTVTYRAQAGSDDCGGIYGAFDRDETTTLAGAAVRCRGTGASIQLATWTGGGLSNSIYAPDGLTEAQIQAMAASL